MQLRITYYSGEIENLSGVKKINFVGELGDLTIYYENDIHEERHQVDKITVKEG